MIVNRRYCKICHSKAKELGRVKMAIEVKLEWSKQVVELVENYNQAIKGNNFAAALGVTRDLLALTQGGNLRVTLRAAQALEKIGRANSQILQSLAKEIVAAVEGGKCVDTAARETVILALRWAHPEIDPNASGAQVIEFVKKKLTAG